MRYLLDRLGMSSKYKGYRMLLLALEIALRDEDNLTNIFQRIYTPVAERCGVTPVMVDKNLRSIIDIFWRSGGRATANYTAKSAAFSRRFVRRTPNFWKQLSPIRCATASRLHRVCSSASTISTISP